jgi:hypothetical protein
VLVDGRIRNLSNRKFCLDCSPFGGRNTKGDDPAKTTKTRYTDWSDEKKLIHRARVYRKGLLRKSELIRQSGGGCESCDYNKCDRALHFHHRDPNEKCFELNLSNLWSKSWETILKEYKKCDLLCANCHAETEDQSSQHGMYRKIIQERWGNDFKQ